MDQGIEMIQQSIQEGKAIFRQVTPTVPTLPEAGSVPAAPRANPKAPAQILSTARPSTSAMPRISDPSELVSHQAWQDANLNSPLPSTPLPGTVRHNRAVCYEDQLLLQRSWAVGGRTGYDWSLCTSTIPSIVLWASIHEVILITPSLARGSWRLL